MKSSIFSIASKLIIFVFASIFILLTSFSLLRVADKSPKTLSNEELSKLVDEALMDSSFKLITEADIIRFLGTMKSNMSIDLQKSNELAQKKLFSRDETDYIFSLFGFSNLENFETYANLLAFLGRKYGIDKADQNSQKKFFEILRQRQDKYITDNNLLEKVSQKFAPPAVNMPSECWKCVYDFRDCTTGTVSNWVISYTTMSTTWTNYDMSNGGISITKWEYRSPSRPTITYIKSTYSTSSCAGIYRNCMNSCATP